MRGRGGAQQRGWGAKGVRSRRGAGWKGCGAEVEKACGTEAVWDRRNMGQRETGAKFLKGQRRNEGVGVN